MNEFTRDGLTFDVSDEGSPDGDAIVLLHGFPETKESWDAVVPTLVAAGHRVLRPDQRGYSPRARPRGRRAYRSSELVADVLALADAARVDTFHLVGHDWGGAAAWATAIAHPDRVESLTVLSTPHPRAMVQSMVRSTQLLHSWYMLAFQLPWVPERMFGGRQARKSLVRSGLPAEKVAFYLERIGDMTGAINWYRALPFSPPARNAPVTVPTTYVYSTGDFALGRKAADLTARHVTGPYRYEVLDGVSHWIPEEAPDAVARLILENVGSS
ncbi:MAG TPA: alpha/beta fold hydrolase [Acidimicrobiales bacterium]|nr:alpha/beta fold hydrolase [Acidimicrobiales bacterium]